MVGLLRVLSHDYFQPFYWIWKHERNTRQSLFRNLGALPQKWLNLDLTVYCSTTGELLRMSAVIEDLIIMQPTCASLLFAAEEVSETFISKHAL